MVGRILMGFVAAMIAVLIAHQPIVAALNAAGMVPNGAYSMAAVATAPPALASFMKGFGFAGWPVLFNLLFWGGLWGAFYGLINGALPGGALLKGLIFGLIVVLFNWTVLATLRGQPMFAGMVPMRMIPGPVIAIGFGLMTAFLFSKMRRHD
jgi:hypothetical protein